MGAPLVEGGILALAIATSLVLARASPLLIIPGLLLAGVAIGPHGLGILNDAAFVDGASDVGLVLMLFFTSLFAHPSSLRIGGRIALPLAAYDLVLNFAAAYWIGALFGWDLPSRLILAGVLATSSTGAILTILTNEGRLLRREGHVLVALLWIEDLAFIAYFIFLSGRSHLSGGLPWHLLLGLALFALFLALLYFLRDAVWRIPHREILIPLVTGIGLLGAWLGNLGGLPYGGAAFTTGLILSGTRGARFIQTEAPHLRHASTAAFFFPFGALIDPVVAWNLLPLVGLAILSLVFTELFFLPQVARLLGLNLTETFVLGGSLMARGGKSASFARLGDVPNSSAIIGVTGVLTMILTPIAPLLVRLALWVRSRQGHTPPIVDPSEALSQATRRVLAKGEYAQRNLVPWWDRVALVEWLLLPFLLGVLASLLPSPWRLVPLAFGLGLLVPAYQYLRAYFHAVPGTPTTTYRLRRRPLPLLETYLPSLLLGPTALALVLPLVAPLAATLFPIAAVLTFAFVFALPYLLRPSRAAPFVHAPIGRPASRAGLRPRPAAK